MDSTVSSGRQSAATLLQELRPVIADLASCPLASVVPNAMLQRDLGMDSLGIVELTIKVEELYAIEVPDERARPDMTVAEVVAMVADCLDRRASGPAQA